MTPTETPTPTVIPTETPTPTETPEPAPEVTETPAANIIDSGACGENINWTLDETGTLEITGTGGTYRYGLIGQDSFVRPQSWDSATRAVVHEGVTALYARAFLYCYNLKEVSLPQSLTLIEEEAFNNCGIESIVIPNGVTRINEATFGGCGSLRSVTLPAGLTTIDYFAFDGCRSLTSIVLPEGLQEISMGAFEDSGLVSVTIPSSLRYIDANAFHHCPNLTEVIFTGPAPIYDVMYSSEPDIAPGESFTAWYPANDPSWTEEIRKIFGKTLRWQAY